MATALLVAAIVVGSRNLQNFDPALVIYTFAVIFATWGIVYHYAVWLNKPPTRRFFDRTFDLIGTSGPVRAASAVIASTARNAHRSDRHSSGSDRACAGGCTSSCSGVA